RRRGGAGRRRDPPAAASLHARPDGLDPLDRRRPRGARPDRRRDAAARRDPRGLPLSSALPARLRALPRRAPRAHGRGRHALRLLAGGRMSASPASVPASGPAGAKPLLELAGVAKTFDDSPPWLNRVLERKPRALLRAVAGVDLAIARGETFGLVGE